MQRARRSKGRNNMDVPKYFSLNETMYIEALRESLLPWKSNKYYIFVCACVWLRARACGCPGAWASACACVRVALLIQHSTRMCHILTPFVALLAPPHFSTLCHKRRDFRKKVTEHKMCFDFLYNFCLNISHSKKNLARYCHKCENVFM